jgi:hypothetical protein
MKHLFIFLLLFNAEFSRAQNQNLYDEKHSMDFARHLYQSAQYESAINEFERVLFLNEHNDTAKHYLISSYIRSAQFTKGITASERWFKEAIYTNKTASLLHSKLLIGQQGDRLQEFSLRVVNDTLKSLMQMQYAFMQAQWTNVQVFHAQGISLCAGLFEPFTNVVNQTNQVKKRSGFVAGTMSAIVPGSGKVYTGNWKDGVISLIMISATTFQAYRGYNRNGFESPKFWIFGGLTMGFYTGNIYGSAKAAQKFNRKQQDALIKKSKQIYFSVGDY